MNASPFVCRGLRRFTLAAALTAALAATLPAGAGAATAGPNVAAGPVQCLLPGQIRKLGGDHTYLTPRVSEKISAAQCAQRGGEIAGLDTDPYASTPSR